MSQINIVDGDLLSAKETYIAHQVNCYGKMGRGVAAQIMDKYPDVYRRYQNYCEEHCIRDLIGRILLISTYDGKIICNLFGQEQYGLNRQHTDMKAISKCFYELDKIVPHNERIAMPYMIGCGNGGGRWETIYELIQSNFKKHDVALYKP